MRCAQILIYTAALAAAATPPATRFSGASALGFTRSNTAFGARPVDTPAHVRTEQFLLENLRKFGCPVEQDAWTARTPLGPKRMVNLIVRVPGRSGTAVAITGHYDTKLMPGTTFVGANDGGSSAGFLLEMARITCGKPRKDALWLVWLDGEEALRQQWSSEDSLYGSRRLAARWAAGGEARRVKALVNVDMIGDSDLSLVKDLNSNSTLIDIIWGSAAELGYARQFPDAPGAIEDDHVPFLRAGIAAADLIDFDYGPGNSFWHTDRDTMDKLAAHSFQIIGDVLLRTLRKLEDR